MLWFRFEFPIWLNKRIRGIQRVLLSFFLGGGGAGICLQDYSCHLLPACVNWSDEVLGNLGPFTNSWYRHTFQHRAEQMLVVCDCRVIRIMQSCRTLFSQNQYPVLFIKPSDWLGIYIFSVLRSMFGSFGPNPHWHKRTKVASFAALSPC